MKTIKLENSLIVSAFQFLQGVNLKGKASRGRTQFIKRLEEKNKEFNEALTDIRKEYFEVDENGEFKTVGEQLVYKEHVTTADKASLNKQVEELNKENFEIQFGEYSTKYDALFTALDDLEIELSGQEAFAYNELMDAYEANEEEK